MNLSRLQNGAYSSPEDPGEPTTTRPRVSVTDDEAVYLAERLAGLRVLEVGTGLGVSTRAIAAVASFLATVDPDEWVHREVWPGLPDGVVTLTEIPAAAAWRDLELPPLDAVFVDGSHLPGAVAHDLDAARALMVPGGKYYAHDWAAQGVQEGIRRSGLEVIEVIATAHGIAVLQEPPS